MKWNLESSKQTNKWSVFSALFVYTTNISNIGNIFVVCELKIGRASPPSHFTRSKNNTFLPPPPLPHCHSAVRFISLAARDYKQPANISRKRKNKTCTKHGTTSSQFANAHNIFVLNARTEHGPPFNSIKKKNTSMCALFALSTFRWNFSLFIHFPLPSTSFSLCNIRSTEKPHWSAIVYHNLDLFLLYFYF